MPDSVPRPAVGGKAAGRWVWDQSRPTQEPSVSRTANTAALAGARDLLLATRTDWQQATATFSWPTLTGPFCWATDWFDAVGRGNDALALWIVEQDGSELRLSYDDLVRRSDQVATWLAQQGVDRGDRVILMLGNQVELWESALAVMKLGAVVLPTTTALGPDDLADRVARGGVQHVIANVADVGKFAGLDLAGYCVDGSPQGWGDYRKARLVTPERFEAVTEPGDPLLLYFTSGTTSRPKLVEHTQVSYPVGHLSTMYWIGLQPGDLHLNISSPGWAKHAWSCLFAPFLAQAAVFVYNYSRFDGEALLRQVRDKQVTTLCAPPTVWRMLVQSDLSAGPGVLREVVAAGEPLNPEVITQVERHWGLTVRDGFGQTETTAQVGNPPGQLLKPGSMGRPLPGIPVVLVDPLTGHAAGTEGELCLDLADRPLALMTGYLGDPERAAEAMADGWYHTGDVAQRDADGYITYIGRADDVFKSSDYKISPFELESVLVEHPAVVEAAVVPVPDPVRQALPKAYVTLAAGWAPDRATALALFEHTRSGLAPYLRVRRLEFLTELPKTVSGKIRRVELRQAEQAEQHGVQWRDEDFPELRSAR